MGTSLVVVLDRGVRVVDMIVVEGEHILVVVEEHKLEVVEEHKLEEVDLSILVEGMIEELDL